MLKDKIWVKNIKEAFKNLTNSARKLYLVTLSCFILTFSFIFISPQIFGNTYSFVDTELNEKENINNNVSVALVRKEFNPEKEIMRLDYVLEGTSVGSSISNLAYNMVGSDIESRKQHDVEIIKINDRYMVVLISGLKEGFSVFSNTIEPYYIHPEIENSNDLEGKFVKTYINENDDLLNLNLEKQDESIYQNDFITYEQDTLKQEIELIEEEKAAQQIRIKETERQIDEIEIELVYMTEEEKFETQSTINTHLTSINQYEKQINELDQDIENKEEKIELFEERRKSISK